MPPLAVAWFNRLVRHLRLLRTRIMWSALRHGLWYRLQLPTPTIFGFHSSGVLLIFLPNWSVVHTKSIQKAHGVPLVRGCDIAADPPSRIQLDAHLAFRDHFGNDVQLCQSDTYTFGLPHREEYQTTITSPPSEARYGIRATLHTIRCRRGG